MNIGGRNGRAYSLSLATVIMFSDEPGKLLLMLGGANKVWRWG